MTDEQTVERVACIENKLRRNVNIRFLRHSVTMALKKGDRKC